MKRLLLLIWGMMLLFQLQNLQAQNSTEIHQKYLYYREKFKKYFVRIGYIEPNQIPITRDDNLCKSPHYRYEGTGWSLPFSRINYDNRMPYYTVYPNPCKINLPDDGYPEYYPNDYYVQNMTAGDATIYLGWYIGVLATEYRLLKNNLQDTTDVVYELYCALKAFERLDWVAENTGFPFASTQNNYHSNGFFLRDDISKSWRNQNFQLQETNDGGTDFEAMIADFKNPSYNFFCNEPKHSGNAPSIDQCIGLFLGFQLIVKCVDNNVSYNGFNFKQKAIEFTDKIIKYIANHKTWIIEYPGTLYPSQPIQKVRFSDGRGLSIGIVAAANKITGNNYNGLRPVNLPLWTLSWLNAANTNSPDNDHMSLTLASICGDCWVEPWRQNKLKNTFDRVLFHSLGTHKNRFWRFYPLLFVFLHGYPSSFTYQDMKNILYNDVVNELASEPCLGPAYHCEAVRSEYYQRFNYNEVNGWRAVHKFMKSWTEQNHGGLTDGEFSGLDFMLYFNLYCLVDPEQGTYNFNIGKGFLDNGFHNLEHLKIWQPLCHDSNRNRLPKASHVQPAYFKAKKISSNNWIKFCDDYDGNIYGANVTFQGFEEVHLQTGFSFLPNHQSEFHGFVRNEINNPYMNLGFEYNCDNKQFKSSYEITENYPSALPFDENYIIIDSTEFYQNWAAENEFKFQEKENLNLASEYSIQLFPNPTQDKINVQIHNLEEYNLYFSICDILGKTLIEKQNFKHEIDLNSLIPGVYFIYFYLPNETKLFKVVKI